MAHAQAMNCRPDLVCFSHLRWDFVYQRPQHLLSRAARDYRVLFIEEPVFEAGAEPRLDASRRPEGVVVLVPVLPVDTGEDEAAARIDALLGQFLDGAPVAGRVLWYYTPMALAFSRGLSATAVVYDNMDELSAFLGASPRLLTLERELFARADLVFTGGMSLYAAKRDRHPQVHAFPSGIDAVHFGQARRRQPVEPMDQASIPGPRIGFFGVIDERLDVGLLREAADLRPDWQFIMIGPVVKIDPDGLPKRSNIHWLGPKAYGELPGYLAGWNAGFMPFALNEATRFISPTKTPEFLAAGLPVVSTAIADVVDPYGRLKLVEIATSPGELVERLEPLLAGRGDGWLLEVDRHLAGMSWDSTWARMARLVGEVAADRRRTEVPPLPAFAHAEPARI